MQQLENTAMVKEINLPLQTLEPNIVKCRISEQKCEESEEESYKIFEKIIMSLFSNLIRLQDDEINEVFPDELPVELAFTEENLKQKKLEALDAAENPTEIENIENESIGSLISQGEQLFIGQKPSQKQLQTSVGFKKSTMERKLADSLSSSNEGELRSEPLKVSPNVCF